MNYKYKTQFSNPIIKSENVNFNFNLESSASLNNLKDLIPEDINFDKNIDLLGVAFNAALINVFNRNGDGISSETALKIKDYFIHKPTNIEHDKKKIVGHIVSTAFSDLDNNEILEELDPENLNPVNLSLGAVIYAAANKAFASLVEDSVDSKNDKYMKVSASWELGFNDYLIAAGSENLNEAEIISEEKHIKELSKYLKSFDGEGKLKDGTPVHRLVIGEVYPLGIGFTANPAAKVKGLYLNEDKKKASIVSAKIAESSIEKSTHEDTKNKKNKKNISQKCNLHVIDSVTKISNMEKTNLIEDFKTILDEKIPNHGFSEEAVANVGRVIGEAIKSKSDQYEKELVSLEEEKARVSEAEEKVKEDLTSLKDQLNASQKELEELKAEVQKVKEEEAFNSRMEDINSEYDLSQEDRTLLASEIKTISLDDQDFESYKSKISVMWAHKNKEYILEQEKSFKEKVEAEVQKRISEDPIEEIQTSEASEEVSEEAKEESIEKALDKIEPEQEIVSNNNSSTATEEESLRDRFAKAFSKENITVKL